MATAATDAAISPARSYALRRSKRARPQSFDVEQALGQSVAEAEEQYGTSWADVLNNGAAAKVALRGMRKARGKARGGLLRSELRRLLLHLRQLLLPLAPLF